MTVVSKRKAWLAQHLRSCGVVALSLAAFSVTGCAGSVAPAAVVTGMSAEQRGALHLASITTEAQNGVALGPIETARITQLVSTDIRGAAPGVLDPAAPGASALRVIVTRYDAGNAGARLLLAGLGQIRMDGDVIITAPATGRLIGEYRVAKQFALGGIIGALTKIEDVERGFSKSVAAIVAP